MEESSSNLPMYMYSYPWITDGWTDGLHSVAYGIGPALGLQAGYPIYTAGGLDIVMYY
jgi:putative NADPH-quinone reductase